MDVTIAGQRCWSVEDWQAARWCRRTRPPNRPSAAVNGWEIYGREGTLVVENDSRLLGGKAGDASLDELPIPDRLTWVPGGRPAKARPLNVAQMYRRLGEAIRSGEKATPDFDDAVALHKLIDAIKRASDQGTRQRLD